jgi:hypothetical protein
MIGELVEWLRTEDDDAKIAEGRFDLGGGDMVTCVDYQPSGYDAHPVPGDFAFLVEASESGSYVIVGWVDPWNQGVAKEGEQRLYARDGVDVVGALHVTMDGAEPDTMGLVMALIARADLVDAELEKIKTALGGHTHPSGLLVGYDSFDITGKTAASTDHGYTVGATGCDKVYVT